jgi:hypothetical protein
MYAEYILKNCKWKKNYVYIEAHQHTHIKIYILYKGNFMKIFGIFIDRY